MLHNLLKTSPQSALELIKEKPKAKYHSQDVEADTTALQLCAKNGYIECMLILLCGTDIQIDYEKNDKTALDYAIEYQQPLAAQVLLVFGATSKKAHDLTVDLDIAAGILIWITHHLHLYAPVPPTITASLSPKIQPQQNFTPTQDDETHIPLLDVVTIEMQEPAPFSRLASKTVAGLIRLAAHAKQFEFAKSLAQLDHTSTFSEALTYEVWAALAEEKQHLFLDDKDHKQITQSLEQLVEKPQAYQFLSSACSQKLPLFSDKEDKHPSKDPLSIAASWGNEKLIHDLKGSIDLQNVLSIFNKAVKEDDLVAYATLIKALGAEKAFLFCLETGNRSLFFITMFLTNHYSYEFLQLFPEKMPDIVKLTGVDETPGLVRRMFSQTLSGYDDPRSLSEKKLQNDFFKKINLTDDQFIKIYREHTDIKETNEKTYQEIARFNLNSDKHEIIIRKLAPLLDRKMSAAENVFLSKHGPVRIIHSFLALGDKKSFEATCHAFNYRTTTLFDQFLDKLNYKINQSRYLSFRDYGFNTTRAKLSLIHSVSSAFSLIPALYFTISTLVSFGQIENQLEDNQCVEKDSSGDYNYLDCDVDLSDICATLCAEHGSIEKILVVVFGSTLSLNGIIACCKTIPDNFQKIKQTLFQGKERFDDLTLRRVVPELEGEARILFSQLSEPLTMDSSIKTIRVVLTQEIARRKQLIEDEKMATALKS